MTNLYWSEEMGDAFEKIFEAKATSPTMASDYVQVAQSSKSCAYDSGGCKDQFYKVQGNNMVMIDKYYGYDAYETMRGLPPHTGNGPSGFGDPNSKLKPFLAHKSGGIDPSRSTDEIFNRYLEVSINQSNAPDRGRFDEDGAKGRGEFTHWYRSVSDLDLNFENVSINSIEDITLAPCSEYPVENEQYPWLNGWDLIPGDELRVEQYLNRLKSTFPSEYSHIPDDLENAIPDHIRHSTNWKDYSQAFQMLGLRKHPQAQLEVRTPDKNDWMPNPLLVEFPNGSRFDFTSAGVIGQKSKEGGPNGWNYKHNTQKETNKPLHEWFLNSAPHTGIWNCNEARIDEAFRIIIIPEDLYNRPDAETVLPIDTDQPGEIARLESPEFNTIIKSNFYGYTAGGGTLVRYKIDDLYVSWTGIMDNYVYNALEAKGVAVNRKEDVPSYKRRVRLTDLNGNPAGPANVSVIPLSFNNYLKDHNGISFKERLKDNLAKGVRKYKVLVEVYDLYGGRAGTQSNLFLRFYGKKAGKVKIESVEYLCTNDFGTVRFIVKASSPGNRIASGLFHITPNDEAYKPENVKTIAGTRSANPTPADAGTSPEGDAMVAFDMSFAMSFEESKRFFQDGMRVFAGITDDLGNMNEGADANNLPLIHTTGDSHFNKCGVAYFQTMGGDFRSKEPITSGGANKYNKMWLGQKANANDVDNMKFINEKKYRPVNPNVSDFTFEQGGDTAGCPGIATGIRPTRQNNGDFCFQVNSNGITHDAMFSDISSGLQNISQVYKLNGSYTKYELSKIFTSNRDFNRELPTILDVSAFDTIQIIDDIPADKNAKVIVYSSKPGSNIQVRAAFAKVELDGIKTDRVSYRERNNSTRFRMYINSGDVGSIELVPLNKEAVNVYEGAMFAKTNFITSQANKTDIVRGLVVANGVVAQSTKGSDSKNADLYFKDFTHPILLIDFDAQYLIFRGFGGSDGDTVEREHIGL
ncbi:MAG: hypothetical protein ACOCXT_04380 [Candidatus Dojkabacteria bacterium]